MANQRSHGSKLLDIIEHRYGLPIEGDEAHLHAVMEHYRAKRADLLWIHGEAKAVTMEDYAKAILVSEAARMRLREIAPKRRKKSKG